MCVFFSQVVQPLQQFPFFFFFNLFFCFFLLLIQQKQREKTEWRPFKFVYILPSKKTVKVTLYNLPSLLYTWWKYTDNGKADPLCRLEFIQTMIPLHQFINKSTLWSMNSERYKHNLHKEFTHSPRRHMFRLKEVESLTHSSWHLASGLHNPVLGPWAIWLRFPFPVPVLRLSVDYQTSFISIFLTREKKKNKNKKQNGATL